MKYILAFLLFFFSVTILAQEDKPNYVYEDNYTYGYESTTSKNLLMIRYMGKTNEGSYQLMSGDSNSVIYFTLAQPYKVVKITSMSGRNNFEKSVIMFDTNTIIGSVFEDAIWGRLKVFPKERNQFIW